MAKSLTLEQRRTGNEIVALIKNLRLDPPGQTDPERKKLIKLLSKDKCPPALLMWAALCGSIEMKQSIAKNPAIDQATCDALMMDAEQAPFYVFELLNNEVVFERFMQELYGVDSPYPDAFSMSDLFYETLTCYQEEKWKQDIPNQGASGVLQAELIRILWRFANILIYCKAYSLDYEDQMFIVLNSALDHIPDLSLFSRNVLSAFLRWSQIKQRGQIIILPESQFDRCDSVNFVVDVFLRKFPEPIPFDKNSYYRSGV